MLRRREQLVARPVFVEDTKGSTTYAALHAAFPMLSLSSVFEMCERVRYVVLVLGADNASSNARCKHFIASLCKQHESASSTCGRVLLIDAVCTAHIFSRIVVATFRLTRVIPRVYALAFTCRFPPRYNRLLRAMSHLIHQDLLQGGYVHCADPPAECQTHTAHVLRLTLLRPLHTKGRSNSEVRGEAFLLHTRQRLCGLLNGDVRRNRVTHYCRGCCNGYEDCARKIMDVLLVAFLEQLGSVLPSTNKWWTYEPAMVPATALLLLHGLLQRAVVAAYSREADQEIDGEDENVDFHKYAQAKVRQTLDFVRAPESPVDLAIALWASEGLDKLSATMQHIDAHGKSLLDATHPNGPAMDAERYAYRIVTGAAEIEAPPLSAIVHHFAANPEVDIQEVTCAARARAIQVAAQIWSRFIVQFESYPWRLIRVVDPRTSEEEQRNIMDSFLDAPLCDLDAGFSAPLRDSLLDPRPSSFDAATRRMLQALAEVGHTTNMHLESLLNVIKCSTPFNKHKPTAERTCNAGVLAQMMSKHLDSGGADNRGKMKRKEMLVRRLPIRAARRVGSKKNEAQPGPTSLGRIRR